MIIVCLLMRGTTASFCMQNEGDIKLNMEPPRCTLYRASLPPPARFFSSSPLSISHFFGDWRSIHLVTVLQRTGYSFFTRSSLPIALAVSAGGFTVCARK